MKHISSFTGKPVKRKTGARSALALVPFVLLACNGDPPGSVGMQADDYPVNTQAAAAIGSEGEKLFKVRCAMCHSVEPGKPSVVGPSLAGIIGKQAGFVEGFAYSRAMRAYGKKWTTENLDEFLEKPLELVPGNRMAFGGMSNAEQRKLIIEYLETFR